MKLRITHETVYDYSPPVETAQHMAYLTPRHSASQQLLSHHLQITPQPTHISSTADVFGNTRHFFSLQVPHRQLQVVGHSQVLTQPGRLPDNLVGWESVRERFRYHASSTFDSANEFVFASAMAPHHRDFANYARPSFTPGGSLLLCALDLMHRIYRDFTYESLSTEVNTPALQALAQRKGVCQDFAHIFVACLRSLGLAARYVSGYLLTAAAPGTVKLRGSDASHAWASVYLPAQSATPDGAQPGESACWVDMDPTNDRAGWPSPGEDYVTLAVGRDFSDVSPMRGVIHGGASHVLTVGVTVEPAEPIALDASTAPESGQSQTQGQSQSQTQGQGQGQSQSQSQTPGFF